jgi:hypothetical protein
LSSWHFWNRPESVAPVLAFPDRLGLHFGQKTFPMSLGRHGPVGASHRVPLVGVDVIRWGYGAPLDYLAQVALRVRVALFGRPGVPSFGSLSILRQLPGAERVMAAELPLGVWIALLGRLAVPDESIAAVL